MKKLSGRTSNEEQIQILLKTEAFEEECVYAYTFRFHSSLRPTLQAAMALRYCHKPQTRPEYEED